MADRLSKRRASETAPRQSFEFGDPEVQQQGELAWKRSRYCGSSSRISHRKWYLVLFGFTTLFLFFLTDAKFLSKSSTRVLLSKVFQAQTSEDDQSLAILLHPEKHVFRRARTISHNWIITSGIRAPDGVDKEVFLINGQFPGPALEVRTGDKLEILVQNALTNDEITIHWHGLHMHGANSMDGAMGMTQAPIPAGGTFKYCFKIAQHGTFWYHAHSHSQRGDGLYGGLVAHRPKEADGRAEKESFGYEHEVLLLVGDWYHRRSDEVLEWYQSVRAFRNEPVPDSLLVNDGGKFDCALALPARPVQCGDVVKRPIFASAVNTRVRVVNVGTMAGITLQVSNATLTPIQLDGGFDIAGKAVERVGILYPGERVDMLLEWLTSSSSDRSPIMTIELDDENFRLPNPALKRVQSFPAYYISAATTSLARGDAPIFSALINSENFRKYDVQTADAMTSPDEDILPETAAETIILYTKTQTLAKNNNHALGFMNQTSWAPQAPHLLSIPRSEWNRNQFVPRISLLKASPEDRDESNEGQLRRRRGKWVDIILNNLDEASHPFHLHGHSFWVVESYKSSRGWGSWKTPTDSSQTHMLERKKMLKKDTVLVPRRGYVILRVRFDNPGLWMLHCHLAVHLGSGMAMAFEVVEGEE